MEDYDPDVEDFLSMLRKDPHFIEGGEIDDYWFYIQTDGSNSNSLLS
jgi:hypothetical protein